MVKISGAMSAFGEPNADSPAAKLPYCGADAANEEPLPEPSETELRAIELEAELTSLRHEVKHLRCALKAAATVLAPYHAKLNGR